VDYVTDPLNIGTTPGNSLAIKSTDCSLTYAELNELVHRQVQYLESFPDGLLILGFSPDIDSVVTYLAALHSDRSIMLIDPKSSNLVVRVMIDTFRPTLLGGIYGVDSKILTVVDSSNCTTPKSLVFLPTSGSTGSAKMVRLPVSAVTANASSISQVLKLTSGHVAPLNLPLFYSYGLSILNSHLSAGACVTLSGQNFMESTFWKNFDTWGCTSLAGVPVNYAMLKRLKFDPREHPSLTCMTQAGGRLPIDLQMHFHGLMEDVGGQFFIMYGQTEASARMAVLPHADFLAKKGSVGYAIPGGRFKILNDENIEVGMNNVGNVVYSGPNVMQGYSESAEDVAQGDIMRGTLETGDLGYLDEDDCLWITGRTKRIAKIFGTRVNLDDVEEMSHTRGFSVAAIPGDDRLILIVEGLNKNSGLRKELARELGVHHSGIEEHLMESLPLLPSGKRDYAQLMKLFS
jgi:acyl-CoA synthetase (AMP-forming)/AMP-acid ligase II